MIRGNHDKAASGIDDGSSFNYVARLSAQWTFEALSPAYREYLRNLPQGPTSIDDTVEICHGAPFDEDHYIFDGDDAARVADAYATAYAEEPFVRVTSSYPATKATLGSNWCLVHAVVDEPNRRLVAFDMLGDIYVMPISGGTPTRIAEGLSYEQQPRWSPDGSRLAFVSDRGGGDNIWLMNADGSSKKQLTKEDFRLLNQPSWSPDGRYIVAKKHFTTARSLGTGEVWLYHVDGGSGVQLVKRENEKHQKELGEPTFSPDGQYVYFTRNITPGAIFQYAQDSNGALFAIDRYEMDSGETHRVTGGNGGAVRPTPSPDGKYLAFVRRERAKSKLYVRDLASGNERKIYDALDQDMQETWAVTGVYPNMDWTADSREVVFWAGGWHAVLGEERRHQCVGVAHHCHGHALIDDPIETQHDGHALPGPHGYEDRGKIADQQLAQELQLLDHLAGGESSRRGGTAVVLADVKPDGIDFTAERADHFGHDVEQEPELPFDG